MAKLRYKTKNNIEPINLQKIWLCAHPKDVFDFLQTSADNILSLVNCSIWYDEEPTENYDMEELFDNFSKMKLFIIPVTKHFLIEDNRAFNIELNYAIDNHIPVLPLIDDPSLTDLFNEKCGNIQYLSLDDDETTISYNEKLKKFLSSVLLDDSLIERVKSAFDAYIFLSYRKKDRKYANELMRLIHCNDFCRDVAIWYDEFLTPGENFNEEISKAIKKSSIFALAVTPNILEDNNYVLKYEYPMALESGLHILPAEMLETNRKDLKEKFAFLPEVTNAYESNSLSPALLEALSNIAVRANDSNPVHNFFIGLAYLGGIDVEVNQELALSLINSASEAGVTEATDKLINMYLTGDGVKRDINTAIKMAERFLEQTQEKYLNDKSLESYGYYYVAIYNLTKFFINEGKYKKALEVLDMHLERIKGVIWEYGEESKFNYLELIIIKAECLNALSNYSGTVSCYEEYLSRCETFKIGNLSELDILNRLRVIIALVDVLYKSGDFQKGNQWFNEAEAELKKVDIDTKSIPSAKQAFACYNSLASMMDIRGRYESALSLYEKGYEFFLRIKGYLKLKDELKEEYIYNSSYARVLLRMKKYEEAEKRCLLSKNFAIDLLEQTGSLTAKGYIAYSYKELGTIAMLRRKYEEAKEFLYNALKEYTEIIEKSPVGRFMQWKSVVIENLGKIALEEGFIEESIKYTKMRIEVIKEMIKNKDSLIGRYMLGVAYADYALQLDKTNHKDEALNLYTNAAKQQELVYEFSSEAIHPARARKVEGDYAYKLGYYGVAYEAYEKSYNFYMESVGLNKTDKEAVIHLCELLAEKTSDARNFYEVALRYYDMLLKEFPNDNKYKEGRDLTKTIFLKSSFEEEKDEELSDDDLEALIASVYDED